MRSPYASLGCAAWTLVSLAIPACGADSDAEDSRDYYQASLSSTRYALPGKIVDHRGRRWNCPKKAAYTHVIDVPDLSVESKVVAVTEPTRDPMQLALALRSVTDINGFECESEPDVELAKRLLDEQDDSHAKTPGTLAADQLPPWTPSGQQKDACCDNDERKPFTGTFTNALLFSERGCTAFFVSPSLAMTAAHCVYNTETDRFYRIVDGLGDDVRPAWRIAVGRSENWPYVTPDCFQVHVPGAFIGGATANDVPEHDYAVIDFSQDSRGPCRNPEPAPQWLGSWITYDDELREDQPWCRFGYPRYVHQGGGPIGGPGLTDQYRSILNAYVDANPWWILRSNWKDTQLKLQGPFLRHNLDASKGDSGSPTLRYDGSGWYVVGLHNASSNGQLRDRRWDWTVRNWVYGKKPF